MSWRQTRPCDGVCCEAQPRFPTRDGKSCIYLDPVVSDKRCLIQRGDKKLPDEPCPVLSKMSSQEAFDWSCVGWPHNMKSHNALKGCCWEYIYSDDEIKAIEIKAADNRKTRYKVLSVG